MIDMEINVLVPADYCGVHTKWPGTGVPPAVMYKNVRTHDGPIGTKWFDIETAAGVYSWTNLDAAVTAWRTVGATVSYALYGTPTFYASVADAAFLDTYTRLGGAAYPARDTNFNGLRAFITALISRYNSPDGAWRIANPTLGKGLAYVETWNEPRFDAGRVLYWWGSAAQLVDLASVVYLAVKAVDPSVIVLSPACDGAERTEKFLQSRGSVYPIAAADTCDGIGTHVYGGCSWGSPYAGMRSDTTFGESGVFDTEDVVSRYKPGAHVYITEYGFISTASTALTSFVGESATKKYQTLGRNMLLSAAYGAKRFGCFTLSTFCGDFVNDANGVIRAFTDVDTAIAGKTITRLQATLGGVVTVTTSDGAAFTI